MGTFGPSKRQVFKPSVYQPGRHNRRLPRGLGLLCIGIALGAGGVLFLQTNYSPPRLTAEQSEQVRSELNTATLERQRLQAQIDELQRQLEASRSAAQNQAADAAKPDDSTQPTSADAAPAQTPAPAVVAAPAPAPALAPPTASAASAVATPPVPARAAAAPDAPQEGAAATPEAAKPQARRPERRDYEEPHSELRMTIIPMTPQSK